MEGVHLRDGRGIDGGVQAAHDKAGDGLRDQRFHCKGNGKVSRPLVKEQTNRLKGNGAGANPCADDGEKDGHE